MKKKNKKPSPINPAIREKIGTADRSSESHNPMVKAMMKVASKMFGVFLPFFQEIKKQFPEKKPKKKRK